MKAALESCGCDSLFDSEFGFGTHRVSALSRVNRGGCGDSSTWPVGSPLPKNPCEGWAKAIWQRFQALGVALLQRLRINFLLCMLNGFALAKPLCWSIKNGLKRGCLPIG